MKFFSLKSTNLCLLLLILTCESDDPILENLRKTQREQSEKELMTLMLGTDYGILNGCENDEIITSIIDRNEESYLADKNKKYTSAIIGDSTMSYSEMVLGFYNPFETKSITLFGNTLCGMILQVQRSYISKINDPKFILTASMGGNDLLPGSDPISVGNRGILLIKSLIENFPLAKLTFVLIHPNLVHYVNYGKNISNAIVTEYVSQLQNSNVCLIDPVTEVFHIGPKDIPSSHLMRDPAHYTARISMDIRALAISKCGMVF